jgi:peptide/nickel transport system substrate-binding protein
MFSRRQFGISAASAGTLAALSLEAQAQGKKDALTLGMTLEPTGLDPTAGAASAIAEVTLYNIYETLTKINADGTVSPLLAESWEIAPDLKSYTFKLKRGVKFSNGTAFDASIVKAS